MLFMQSALLICHRHLASNHAIISLVKWYIEKLLRSVCSVNQTGARFQSDCHAIIVANVIFRRVQQFDHPASHPLVAGSIKGRYWETTASWRLAGIVYGGILCVIFFVSRWSSA